MTLWVTYHNDVNIIIKNTNSHYVDTNNNTDINTNFKHIKNYI